MSVMYVVVNATLSIHVLYEMVFMCKTVNCYVTVSVVTLHIILLICGNTSTMAPICVLILSCVF